jgi:hypothetical protein
MCRVRSTRVHGDQAFRLNTNPAIGTRSLDEETSREWRVGRPSAPPAEGVGCCRAAECRASEGTPAHSKRGATVSNGDSLAVTLGGQRDCVGRIAANLWKDRVELLAATVILGISVGCGLAAARVALESLFSLMTFHSAFQGVSPAPLPMERFP